MGDDVSRGMSEVVPFRIGRLANQITSHNATEEHHPSSTSDFVRAKDYSS